MKDTRVWLSPRVSLLFSSVEKKKGRRMMMNSLINLKEFLEANCLWRTVSKLNESDPRVIRASKPVPCLASGYLLTPIGCLMLGDLNKSWRSLSSLEMRKNLLRNLLLPLRSFECYCRGVKYVVLKHVWELLHLRTNDLHCYSEFQHVDCWINLSRLITHTYFNDFSISYCYRNMTNVGLLQRILNSIEFFLAKMW